MSENAIVFDIKRFAVHDGDGIRTTVFLKGCPLHCLWCHNPEGIDRAPQLGFCKDKCVSCGNCIAACETGAQIMENGTHRFDQTKCIACGNCEATCMQDALRLYGKVMTSDELLPILLKDRDFYENSNGGVTVSGGECLIYPEFCRELLQKLKTNGIHTAVDTCGFVSRSAIDAVIPFTDIFLYDIKALDEDVHIKCTGKPNRIILENLLYLDKVKKPVEIRIPFVPDYNSDQIGKIGDFLSRLNNVTRIRVLPYHNYAGSKYLEIDAENTLPKRVPTEEELTEARNMLKDMGFDCL